MLLMPNFDLTEKNRKSSYQPRQIFAFFFKLNCSNLAKTVLKAIELPKLSKKLGLTGSGTSQNKKKRFPETISYKIFGSNSSFNVKK